MAIYHDVRELMQEDNRPTFVGVVRFKMEINVTREWYRLGNAMPSAARNWISKSPGGFLGGIIPQLRRDPAVLRVAGCESARLLVYPT